MRYAEYYSTVACRAQTLRPNFSPCCTNRFDPSFRFHRKTEWNPLVSTPSSCVSCGPCRRVSASWSQRIFLQVPRYLFWHPKHWASNVLHFNSCDFVKPHARARNNHCLGSGGHLVPIKLLRLHTKCFIEPHSTRVILNLVPQTRTRYC